MSAIKRRKPAHFAAMASGPRAYSAAMPRRLNPSAPSAAPNAIWPGRRALGACGAGVWLAFAAASATAAPAGLGLTGPTASSTTTPVPPVPAAALPPGWGLPGPADGGLPRASDDPITSELEATLREQLQQVALASTQQALPGVSRVEIEVGRLDPRLRLAACARVEPYLPTGTRLWGKARIGLRCTQGPTPWNVFLPVTVKVFGPAWVAAGTLAAGAQIGPGDLVPGEVDWAAENAPVVTDPEQAIGRVLQRRLTAGQGVRSADLRPKQWFNAGDVVKLVAIGRGYTITGSGEALTHGIEGQPVRVRTDSGKVVVGQVAGERRVELRP